MTTNLEIITRTSDLERLEPEWTALWRRCPEVTPFQSPAWLLPWWRHFSEGELLTIVLREEGRLLGVAPFYIRPDPDTGLRQVLLLGTGNTDYLDILLETAVETLGSRRLADTLLELRERWDVCDFQQLREYSPVLRMPPLSGFSEEAKIQDVCPVLDLAGETGELAQVVPAGFRERIEYLVRRANRMGGLRFVSADPSNLEELLEIFQCQHEKRWRDAGQGGVLGDLRTRSFLREVSREMLGNSCLRLHVLWLRGKPIASVFGFAYRERAYFYLSGYDPEFSYLSPGSLALHLWISQAAAGGLEEFDFLRGAEPYKYRWGAKDRFNWRRRTLPLFARKVA